MSSSSSESSSDLPEAVPPAEASEPDVFLFPASFAQRRLWFLDQFEPGNPLYNIPVAARLLGPLKVRALTESLNEIVRRHEILRTTFANPDGEPVQLIAPHLRLAVPLLDLSETEPDQRLNRALQMATEEGQRPFDLEQGPLLRCSLLRLADKEHVLLVTMHHIISDGWSLNIFFRELMLLYEAYAGERPHALPELAIQYADFTLWQLERLSGDALEKHLSYWREQLDGLSVLELPTDYPRPSKQHFRGAHRSLLISSDLTADLKKLGRDEGVTLYMLLLGAWQTLLFRYTGEQDISIGTPIAGRTHAEVEELIGFFVNTLVLRTKLEGDLSFRRLLARVRSVSLGAYAHQELPFEKLVEDLRPERDMSHSPLFQVMFALQSNSLQRMTGGGLTLDFLPVESGTAKTDVSLEVLDFGDELKLNCGYSTDLFDDATMERMLAHYENLLAAVVADPERRLSELPLLSEDERTQLLYEWNETAIDYPAQASVQELFEEEAARRPGATAIISGDSRISYGELNARANRLAHYLRREGVGPETPVGLCLERSVEMLIGLLGIVKAGGLYVPFEPSLPEERRSFILRDSRVKLLLTQTHLLQSLSSFSGPLIALDVLDPIWAAESDANPPRAAGPDNLIYVMYTSGSTGRPKGVCITHRGVVRLVKRTNYLELQPGETLLLLAPFSFDASTFEIWFSLLNGARLGIPEAATPSLREIAHAVEQYQVKTLWLTTGLFHLMVDEQLEMLKEMRLVMTGGEVLSIPRAEKFVQQVGGQRLINFYGPTENTTFTSFFPFGERAQFKISVPIGRPVANTQVYILDEHLNPVPVGVVGELCTAGDGLARGYLNQPDLTALKFRPNPYSLRPGERLYRTGDLARYLEDGNIEFVGRRDHQVKIRGFRIELGEIEAVLRQHQAVKETVVVVRDAAPGDKRLTAYVVQRPGSSVSEADLRAFLQDRLPDYMVPSAFLMLEAMPMNSSGKIDRGALPAPSASTANQRAQRSKQALTPTEEILCGIWRAVLHLGEVGREDNFFEVGGHSLLATQVISRVRRAFGVELPLRVLFERPTIESLAARIESDRQSLQATLAPPILPVPRNEKIPLSFQQEWLWLVDRAEPGTPIYNMPYAVRCKGGLDLRTLAAAFTQVMQRHESLRTCFAISDNKEPVQIILPSQTLSLSMTDLSELPEQVRETELRRQCLEIIARPFDLTTGPLLRAHCIRLGEREHILLLVLHHIIMDGWSRAILLSELTALYGAALSGSAAALPELKIQYADYAHWQRNWMRGDVLERYLSYWKRQLEGAPAALELPTDRPRRDVQTYRGKTQPFKIPAELTMAVKDLSRCEDASLYMTLLAAFSILLYRYTGQRDIVVGSDIANRPHEELENVLGFFLNTVAVRTDLSANPDFRQLLKRVRRAALGAYEHQELPFELLLERLGIERRPDRQPLFQVMLLLQNMDRTPLALAGTELEPLALNDEDSEMFAKFDLELVMADTDQGLIGALLYNADLFTQATSIRILEDFVSLLENIVKAPTQSLSALAEQLPGWATVQPGEPGSVFGIGSGLPANARSEE